MKEYFPLFIKCDGKSVAVIGGGKIALRRVKSLLDFNFKIKVISREFLNEFEILAEENRVEIIKSEYREEYIEGNFMVLACTDDERINSDIVRLCNEKNILVNTCSSRADCDFYFPYIINTNEVSVGLIGDGSDHNRTKKIGDSIENFMRNKGDE